MRSISGKFFIVKTQNGFEIAEIISLGKNHLLVQWWFTKQFFIKKNLSQEQLKMISEGELIRSPIKYQDWIPFDSIIGKINILTEKEYFLKDFITNDVFFIRSSTYNPKIGELKIDGESRCSECKKVINPDFTYIIEDEPFQLYHTECKH